MGSDELVARLRKRGLNHGDFGVASMMYEAADEIERLTKREAQAKLDGVRAGIEAAARDAATWFPGQSVEKHSNAGVVASIMRLDAEAIAKGEG